MYVCMYEFMNVYLYENLWELRRNLRKVRRPAAALTVRYMNVNRLTISNRATSSFSQTSSSSSNESALAAIRLFAEDCIDAPFPLEAWCYESIPKLRNEIVLYISFLTIICICTASHTTSTANSTRRWVRDIFNTAHSPLSTAMHNISHNSSPMSPCHFRVGTFFLLLSKFSSLSWP